MEKSDFTMHVNTEVSAKGRGAIVIRWGAYGDLMYCLPLMEHLSRKYGYLHLEATPQGGIFLRHPLIHSISTFNINSYAKEVRDQVAQARWFALEMQPYEFRVNLWKTLESACIVEEWEEEFQWPRERRREKYGERAFHDSPWIKANEPIPDPFDCGTMYFSEDEITFMNGFKDRNHKNFVVAVPVRGHPITPQKQPIGIKEVCADIIDNISNAKIYLVGNDEGIPFQFRFGDDRDKKVVHMCGKTPYMEALAIMKVADFAFGVESSLLVGAGIFGTPKSALCTSSGVHQVAKYHKNDFSVQSTAPCSPCHRAIYKHDNYCILGDYEGKKIPACNGLYDKKRILEGVDFAYKIRNARREYERENEPEDNGYGSLPDFKREEKGVQQAIPREKPELREGIPQEVLCIKKRAKS